MSEPEGPASATASGYVALKPMLAVALISIPMWTFIPLLLIDAGWIKTAITSATLAAAVSLFVGWVGASKSAT